MGGFALLLGLVYTIYPASVLPLHRSLILLTDRPPSTDPKGSERTASRLKLDRLWDLFIARFGTSCASVVSFLFFFGLLERSAIIVVCHLTSKEWENGVSTFVPLGRVLLSNAL